MGIINYILDKWRGNLLGASRSNKWPTIRKQYLKQHPRCAVCGKVGILLRLNSVHHKRPFNAFPELELEPQNLATLCESKGMSCHITFGHLGNFRFYNPNVNEDIRIWKEKVKQRAPNTNQE